MPSGSTREDPGSDGRVHPLESAEGELGSGRRWQPDVRTVAFALSLLGVAALIAYDASRPDYEPLVGTWQPRQVDWLFLVSLSMVCWYVAVPALRRRPLVSRYLREVIDDPIAAASLCWLGLFALLGLVGPVLVGSPQFSAAAYNPPVGLSADAARIPNCVGPVANGQCHGTLAHPLGTDTNGRDVLTLVVHGAAVALKVTLVTATLIVPIGVVVGSTAALVGGRVDAVAMRYVDVQQVIPPFFVYIVAQYVFRPTLFLMVVVFGLLNWGGTARQVRSEALQVREEGFMLAARSAGGSAFGRLRRHLVPNVASTVVTAVTLQLPALVVVEATLSYLQLGDPSLTSWGNLVSVGMQQFPYFWWVVAAPALALLLTVVSLNVLGDALRDALDPRLE